MKEDGNVSNGIKFLGFFWLVIIIVSLAVQGLIYSEPLLAVPLCILISVIVFDMGRLS
jgi:hypothetical protein